MLKDQLESRRTHFHMLRALMGTLCASYVSAAYTMTTRKRVFCLPGQLGMIRHGKTWPVNALLGMAPADMVRQENTNEKYYCQ